jgi:hypothetical protein
MSDAVETTPRFKVGDELAFRVWWPTPGATQWRIVRIARITPSGVLVFGAGRGATKVRVKGGRLVVIGDSRWTVEPVTDEIRRHILFHEMIGTIEKTKWRDLNEDIVTRVYRIVHAWKPVEEDR